ncbi:hypothetical protein EWM64_g7139 [Hericium alpestre]|uniref:Uncharacterized protein n=1 Tax=Hericium alpestre TaxID=135208 RepID=A0A4Y9ZRI7_9AGAM|nr:hypothetical protein EWM64_g7139 [Hericium alpestre]
MHTCDEDLPAVAQGRRRSVDIGGLHLALGDEGSGQGWVGWEECARSHPCYAELLSDMYTQTHAAVNTDEHLTLLVIPDKTRRRLIRSLDSWHFEPHKLPDEEVLFCSLILFEALFRIEGLPEAVQVSISALLVVLFPPPY